MLLVGEVGAKITGDTLPFEKALNDVKKMGERTASEISRNFGKQISQVGKKMSIGLTAPILAFQGKSVQLFNKQAQAIAQVEQGIKSTGGSAGFTLKQFENMASELQGMTLFGDEEILQGATAQLLTFTNIANEEFSRTQKVALDLATRLDGDLKSASIQLGKALNDPVSNLSALSRSGIQFSDDQEKVIKSLAETGRLAEAQRVILAELEKQYGGSAEAAAKAGAGGMTQLKNEFGDLLEDIGKVVYEGMQPFIEKSRELIKWVRSLGDDAIRAGVKIASIASIAGPALIGLGVTISAVGTAIAAITSPITLVVGALAGLAAGTIYLADNWEAVKERISDWSWWRNMLVDMGQFLIEYSPISLMIKQLNAALSFFGQSQIPNPFENFATDLEELKVETKEYENQFGSFKDAVINGINEMTGLDLGSMFSFDDDSGDGILSMRADIDAIKVGANEAGSAINLMRVNTEGLSDPLADAKEGYAELYHQNMRAAQGTTFLKGLTDQFTNSFGQGMSNVLVQSQDVLKTLNNIGKLLLSSAIQKAISVLLTGGLGGTGFFGDGGGIFGALFGGGKASGGPVSGGTTYLVGERGPELFTPSTSGNIIPNNKLNVSAGMTSQQLSSLNTMVSGSTPVLSEDSMSRAFEKALDKKLSKLSAGDIYALAQVGRRYY